MIRIGDRVKVILANESIKTKRGKILNGATGTVKDTSGFCFTGVEFDDDIGGNTGSWNGKNGHCGYVDNKYLEKIEDTEEETKEETKADTLERKILTALREEIGVDIGEEFDVYENGEKQWKCKFEENGFFDETNGKFRETGLWKQIVCKFHSYQFKKKPFVPKYGEEYFFLTIDDDDNENILLDVAINTWIGVETDYGRLALGNVFRTEEEALKSRNEMLERLKKLRNGE